ncbi:hypothetical protein CMV_018146 [Castanea mollissima]|uniref:Uncharacterized protein n=1 Tax=Castanea mollissima TaxID=60419 RepID=A0A8J4QRP5_9ROSI|nr:hypothetical protein CMV_018146 [Castanea mollissima]
MQLYSRNQHGGMGLDFRDSNGLVLAALSEVVNDVHDGGDNRSDSFDIHKRELSSWSLVHVHREGNQAAHNLA